MISAPGSMRWQGPADPGRYCTAMARQNHTESVLPGSGKSSQIVYCQGVAKPRRECIGQGLCGHGVAEREHVHGDGMTVADWLLCRRASPGVWPWVRGAVLA